MLDSHQFFSSFSLPHPQYFVAHNFRACSPLLYHPSPFYCSLNTEINPSMATTHQNPQLSVPEHGNNIVTSVDLNYPSRFVGEVTWKRNSPFLRVSVRSFICSCPHQLISHKNSANFRSAARFAYDTSDSEASVCSSVLRCPYDQHILSSRTRVSLMIPLRNWREMETHS